MPLDAESKLEVDDMLNGVTERFDKKFDEVQDDVKTLVVDMAVVKSNLSSMKWLLIIVVPSAIAIVQVAVDAFKT